MAAQRFLPFVPVAGLLALVAALLAPTLTSGCQGTCSTSADCGDTDFCALATGVCLSSQPVGFCKSRPVQGTCSAVDTPVCGCDGNSYSSTCTAAIQGVAVAANGLCKSQQCDQMNPGCPTGQFCNLMTAGCLTGENAQGVCEVIPAPDTCTTGSSPVCGCNGVTYDNACLAAAASQSLASNAACNCGGVQDVPCPAGQYCNSGVGMTTCANPFPTGVCAPIPDGGCDGTNASGYVCGCDNKTYQTTCAAALAHMSVAATGACACGGQFAVPCENEGWYCNLPEGACLNGPTMPGICFPEPDLCPPYPELTCGCNGKTYLNGCAAAADGQSIAGIIGVVGQAGVGTLTSCSLVSLDGGVGDGGDAGDAGGGGKGGGSG